MLKNAVIAEINAVVRGMIEDADFDTEELEDGIEVETPNFMLKISIDRGVCEICENFPPMFDCTICSECNDDRIYQRKMEDLYF